MRVQWLRNNKMRWSWRNLRWICLFIWCSLFLLNSNMKCVFLRQINHFTKRQCDSYLSIWASSLSKYKATFPSIRRPLTTHQSSLKVKHNSLRQMHFRYSNRKWCVNESTCHEEFSLKTTVQCCCFNNFQSKERGQTAIKGSGLLPHPFFLLLFKIVKWKRPERWRLDLPWK